MRESDVKIMYDHLRLGHIAQVMKFFADKAVYQRPRPKKMTLNGKRAIRQDLAGWPEHFSGLKINIQQVTNQDEQAPEIRGAVQSYRVEYLLEGVYERQLPWVPTDAPFEPFYVSLCMIDHLWINADDKVIRLQSLLRGWI